MTFAIYKLTPLPPSYARLFCLSPATAAGQHLGVHSHLSRLRTRKAAHQVSPRPASGRPPFRMVRKGGSSSSIRSFSSPRARVFSKASTRASRESSMPARCSSCFLAFGIVMLPIPLWAGRNIGSSAKDQFLTRPFAAESCNQPSRSCTQVLNPICCGASSAATRWQIGAQLRTSTSSQRWARICSR